MPSLADLISPKKKVKICEQLIGGNIASISGDAVEMDASVSEDHLGDNEVTDFPVEQGANISDHSRPNPQSVTLRCLITGTPFDLLAIAIPPPLKARRGKDAWVKLHKWRKEGQRVVLITSLNAYGDMVIQSIGTPRTARNADGVEMTIKLRQINTANSLTVDKPDRPENPPPASQGPKPTAPANPAQATKSVGLIRTIGQAVGKKLGLPTP